MRNKFNKRPLRRAALAVALGACLASGAAFGQATTGTIFGEAQAAAGQTVKVTSESGLSRTLTVSQDGSYATKPLPSGMYTVTLMENGEAVGQHMVYVQPGSGSQVNFLGSADMDAQQLGAVTVSASALPPIDVSRVSPSYTLTAQQLAKLPLARNVNSISLLAPGAVSSSNYFDAVTFAGAGASENAYYVNGYNTTALYRYTGPQIQLPYGAIGSQQTLVGGFGAKYGRADGGVMSQIGKRGTNEWHFGGQVTWSPRSLMAEPVNNYYQNLGLTAGEDDNSATREPGDLLEYRATDKSWQTSKSLYAGGPLVEDKLFVFLAVEQEKSSFHNVGEYGSTSSEYYQNRQLTWYGKIDWNINENNILEYTKLKSKRKDGFGGSYLYSYDTLSEVKKESDSPYGDWTSEYDIFHYTSYLSDKATLSIIYGTSEVHNPTVIPQTSLLPGISNAGAQDPADNGGSPIGNAQTAFYKTSPDAGTESSGLRVDFSYRLGDHLLQVGIDNMDFQATGKGDVMTGPGYAWIYGFSEDPNEAINAALGVAAPGEQYYVQKYIYETVTSMSAEQDAWYIQDNWDVTDNLMVRLGLRNGSFTNYNALGQAFVIQEDLWAPRLGFSWDVFGDASLKVYGSLGRYYLALPQATGERAAGGSVYKSRYYTYTGIDENGIPTGLTPVPAVGGGPSGFVSANNEFGDLRDPEKVAALDLDPQYQDELILGFDKTWGENWVYGGKVTYRTVGTIIDDHCDFSENFPEKSSTYQAIAAAGYDPTNYKWQACFIVNPGQDNTVKFAGKGDYEDIIVNLPQSITKLPDIQRDYYAFDVYLSHPYDGKWFGKVSYTFARSWGNAEGQLRSDIGQTDASVTVDWDYWQVMDHARGYLANHRRHQLKAFGFYSITNEWRVSANLLVQSGMPNTCLGLFGPDQTNPAPGYGAYYHWCNGEPYPPGKEINPWTYSLDLGVNYHPAWLDGLALGVTVFNVFDAQEVLQTDPQRDIAPSTVNAEYGSALFRQRPRSIMLTASFDY